MVCLDHTRIPVLCSQRLWLDLELGGVESQIRLELDCLLTRTFRLLQVVHPLELPGIPTMLGTARVGPRTLKCGYEE